MNVTPGPAPREPRLGPTVPNTIQGVFYDESLLSAASWAGLRVLGNAVGGRSGTGIDIIGTDDGKEFYTLSGSFSGEDEVYVDFSPRGGPKRRSGLWADKAISWYGVARGSGERDVWTLRPGLMFKVRPYSGSAPLPTKLEGVFTDAKHLISGTWAGFRMVNEERLSDVQTLSKEWGDFLGDRQSDSADAITLVGSDNGVDFWSLRGRVLAREQPIEGRRGRSGIISIVVDFSPKGGPKELYGKFADGKLTWQDNNYWTLVVPKR